MMKKNTNKRLVRDDIQLSEAGFNKNLLKIMEEDGYAGFEIGRVIAEHKERYRVQTEQGECDGEVMGNLRFTARSREDFPVVGDWVAVSAFEEQKVLIHGVFARHSLIRRKAVGKRGEHQPIAANVDCALIVQAVDRDFNLNRIERYLAICADAKVKPVVVINKTDLISKSELDGLLAKLSGRLSDTEVFSLSTFSGSGLKALQTIFQEGKTYCLMGSSGVGKSSLVNALSGREQMKTGEISSFTERGKHVTSHRELILLANGSLLIDTPGMRELGMSGLSQAVEQTFDVITELASACKYNDCTHTSEHDCAVLEALEADELDASLYDNYIKVRREQQHFEATAAEKKKQGKDLARMIKTVKRNKFR